MTDEDASPQEDYRNRTPSRESTEDAEVLLSVVVPAYEEAENLAPLYRRLREVLEGLSIRDWQLVIVDDGSKDDTWSEISRIRERDDRVCGVRLSRNFGQQYALMAGLERAGGDVVVTMDSDLQHPPELIPTLLNRWRQGAKIVRTVRLDTADAGWFKRWSSNNFYRLFRWLSGLDLVPGTADFRLLDRQVVRELTRFPEEGLFLRGLTEWMGFESAEVSYEASGRPAGTSKYGLVRMLRFAWDGISSFSIVPLRLGVMFGLASSGLSFCGVLYAIYGKFIEGEAIPGWASTVMIISVLFGLLFLYLGVLGEYVGRIVVEVRNRPRFVVDESLGVPFDS